MSQIEFLKCEITDEICSAKDDVLVDVMFNVLEEGTFKSLYTFFCLKLKIQFKV